MKFVTTTFVSSYCKSVKIIVGTVFSCIIFIIDKEAVNAKMFTQLLFSAENEVIRAYL